MTLKEFEEKYCSMCGTQRCGGVTDEEFREGCLRYRDEFHTGKDMSSVCGMHYEEFWRAFHIDRTMSQEEFDEWFDTNCGRCTYMNEVCMKD